MQIIFGDGNGSTAQVVSIVRHVRESCLARPGGSSPVSSRAGIKLGRSPEDEMTSSELISTRMICSSGHDVKRKGGTGFKGVTTCRVREIRKISPKQRNINYNQLLFGYNRCTWPYFAQLIPHFF